MHYAECTMDFIIEYIQYPISNRPHFSTDEKYDCHLEENSLLYDSDIIIFVCDQNNYLLK